MLVMNQNELVASSSQCAQENTTIWCNLMWMSVGDLNTKNYFLHLLSYLNFKKLSTSYQTIPLPSPINIHNHANRTLYPMEELPPTSSRRTLGVILCSGWPGSA